MEIINVLIVLLSIALVLLGALLIAIRRCITLIESKIDSKKDVLHSPTEPVNYPFTYKPFEEETVDEESTVSTYKTKKQVKEEKVSAQTPNVEGFLPNLDEEK